MKNIKQIRRKASRSQAGKWEYQAGLHTAGTPRIFVSVFVNPHPNTYVLLLRTGFVVSVYPIPYKLKGFIPISLLRKWKFRETVVERLVNVNPRLALGLPLR